MNCVDRLQMRPTLTTEFPLSDDVTILGRLKGEAPPDVGGRKFTKLPDKLTDNMQKK